MTISRLFVYDGPAGNTKAFVDLETNEGIILKGFKLILGPTGLFVGAPSEKGKDGKWRESVIIPKELRDEINRMVVGEYDRQRTNTGTPQSKEDSSHDLPF
jgi:DNA-binding cell septation regulator SpoVG